MTGKLNTGSGRGTRLRACGAEACAAPIWGGRSDRPPGRRSAVPPDSSFFQYSNIPAFQYSVCCPSVYSFSTGGFANLHNAKPLLDRLFQFPDPLIHQFLLARFNEQTNLWLCS